MSVITRKQGTLEYLTAEGITAAHGFTTRHGGVSTGSQSSLNLAIGRGDSLENVEKNLCILGDALGFSPEQLVLTHQTHSAIVRTVTEADRAGLDHRAYPECDALITNRPGVGLMIFTADCTPILFHDPVTGAVGAAHAGWRGTAAGIARKCAEEMVKQFGCRPGDIRAAIGPNIAQCCFETDRDVPDAMVALLGDQALPLIRQQGDKYYVNLKEVNAQLLRNRGVTQIEIATQCTACDLENFWSHRKTGDKRGSQGAVILCKEAAK